MKQRLIVAIAILGLILAGLNTSHMKQEESTQEPEVKEEQAVVEENTDDERAEDAPVVAVEEEKKVEEEVKAPVKTETSKKPAQKPAVKQHDCWRCGAKAKHYYTDLWLCEGCYLEKYADDEFAKTTVVVGTCDYCHGDITNQENYGCTEGMEILCEDCYAIHLQDPMDPGPMGEMGRE